MGAAAPTGRWVTRNITRDLIKVAIVWGAPSRTWPSTFCGLLTGGTLARGSLKEITKWQLS